MRALKDLWTPTSRVYDRADEGYPQRRVLDCGIAWQNYRDDAQVWQAIDLTPEVVAGGFRVRKVPYDLTLLSTGARRIAPDRAFAASRFINLPANKFLANKTFTRIGNELRWSSNAYNIVLRWENSRVKFDVVVKRSIPFDSISFDVDKTGITDATLVSFLTNLKAIDSSTPEPIVRPLSVSLVAGVLTLGFDLTGMKFPVTIDPTLDLQVGASADDGEVLNGTGFRDTVTSMRIGNTSDQWKTEGWARFTGVSGLSGATVTAASYWGWTWYSGGSPLTKIYAEKAAAPAAPTSAADFNGKTKTTAGVDWDGTLTPADGWVTSSIPDISSVIQELAVLNPSAIQILHLDDGTSVSANDDIIRFLTYDSNATKAPKFHVDYNIAAARRVFVVS